MKKLLKPEQTAFLEFILNSFYIPENSVVDSVYGELMKKVINQGWYDVDEDAEKLNRLRTDWEREWKLFAQPFKVIDN